LQGIISQRLVRRICSHCKEEVDQQQYRYISHLFPETPRSFYQGKGCFHCQNSGYFGRIAVQETILVDDPLRSLIERREAEEKMRQLISNDKTWKSLMADGMEKVSQGLTTVAEILRVAGPQSVTA
jgi:type II secretory ATPase GspE/PulE/Tfp pilus assembly ATPase PilB-like protein